MRPIHSILCLLFDDHNCEKIDFEFGGIRSGNTTRGHRFEAPDPFEVHSFDGYLNCLRQRKVLLNAEQRKDRILEQAEGLCSSRGLEFVSDPELLEEVAGLVEWPVAVIGEIDKRFLELPPEVLTASMRNHQKYFSARNKSGGVLSHFVAIANLDAEDGGKAILEGNRRVLTARLRDAEFFWRNDLRTVDTIGMAGMGQRLGTVSFHNKLGTQSERIDRIAALALHLALFVDADPDSAEQAARVSKVDLVSETVVEFPEIQGVAGRRLSRIAGFPESVSEACEYHYFPKGPGDEIKLPPVSLAVGLADRIDQLMGFFAIGELPTGSKDPHALRRAAYGIIRIVLGNNLRIPLTSQFELSAAIYAESGILPNLGNPSEANGIASTLIDFIYERLSVHLQDLGKRHDLILACRRLPGSDDLRHLVNRIEALSDFLKLDQGHILLRGFRRANNILVAEEKKGKPVCREFPMFKLIRNRPRPRYSML